MTAGRVLSALVAIGYVVLAAASDRGGPKAALIVAGVVLLPLALIWFPRPIGAARGYRVNRQLVDQPTPPALIAGAGWFFLVGLPLIIYLNWR